MKLLLECGAEVHALNCGDQTPYETSLAYGYREIADLLWKYGTGKGRFDDIPLVLVSTAISDWRFDFSP